MTHNEQFVGIMSKLLWKYQESKNESAFLHRVWDKLERDLQADGLCTGTQEKGFLSVSREGGQDGSRETKSNRISSQTSRLTQEMFSRQTVRFVLLWPEFAWPHDSMWHNNQPLFVGPNDLPSHTSHTQAQRWRGLEERSPERITGSVTMVICEFKTGKRGRPAIVRCSWWVGFIHSTKIEVSRTQLVLGIQTAHELGLSFF